MALPDLHIFERLVKNKPSKGSNDYPLAIKATDLDENWKRTTLIEGEGNPKLYEVEYTKDGTRLTRILPPTPDSGTHVLGAVDGQVQWIATEDCS
jgi:hypothetical protein